MPKKGSLNRDLQYIFYGNQDKKSKGKIIQLVQVNQL